MNGRWVGSTSGVKKAGVRQPPKNTSAAEEQALILAWRKGDRAAGESLVRAFLPFVISIALEYRRWNVPLDDIIQQGSLGLLRAAQRFDPGQNVRLVTYAAYWIRAEIRDFVMRSYRMVRLGSTKSERRALRCFRTTMESSAEQLAIASGLSLERAEALLPLLAASDASLDQGSSDSTLSVHDRIASPEPSPEQTVMEVLDGDRAHQLILQALSELSQREQVIVNERWLAEPPTTLEALGCRLGVTKERVRQIEDRARQKVRARLAELKVA